MRVEEMRRAIEREYPGDRWKRRVAAMRWNQVIAVYRSIEERKSRRSDSTPLPKSRYTCEACNRSYQRDNPDLVRCEYCNTIIGG